MLLSTILLLAQGPGDIRRTMAAGAKEAVVMAPPETVCGAEAGEMVWTASGRNLVVVRWASAATAKDAVAAMSGKPVRIQSRQEIVVWNLQTRRARTAMTFPADTSTIDDLQAVTGTESVLVTVSERTVGANGAPSGETRSISLLSADGGTAVRLSALTDADGAFERASVSPTRPIIAVQRVPFDRKAKSVRFFGPSGKASPPVAVPPRAELAFDASGLPGFLLEPTRGPGKMLRFKMRRIDPVTGGAGAVVDFPLEDGKEAVLPFKAQDAYSVAMDPSIVAPGVFLVVTGGKNDEAGVVSTDGKRPLLSPKFDAIAYVSQGSAMVRGLATMPRAMYDDAKREAEKAAVMSRAKQVGLSLLMYAGDMDDVLPGQNDDVRRLIEPYAKNPKLFEGFTYTFGGGDANLIDKPAETELGFVNGPGGRAVIYADGHVKWRPDAP